MQATFDLDLPLADWAKEEGIGEEEVHERLVRAADEKAAKKAADFGPQIMRQIEKAVLLQTLDHLWREHLVTLEHLRQVIGLRGYGQRDPLNEYKSESFTLFEHMLGAPARGGDRPAHAYRAHAAGGRSAARRGRAAAHGSAITSIRPRAKTNSRSKQRASDLPSTVKGAAAPARSRKASRAKVRTRRSLDLGQGAAERALPVRLRQEIQALPRRLLGASPSPTIPSHRLVWR